ncbi:YggS family pyridoxal phosphate-dependent enzyme [Bacillus chungangensis]|uniref:Pyridoxal phosphate homeostasis protein n=1 Tax=Bacillus chungangensis TaxID=587633 RepID=A0ABT9WX01_9BACI|nr:YggS family pyridoxal phosphate-dependent enzyme [Bacillus chungangensis]MDQ0177649.1 pyridoxal phosphate enzyme (YggS family) [Bacillus chungangensis]
MKVKDNLAVIHEKIEKACLKAGRKTDEVNIVAVTKYVSIDRAKEALQAGLVHLGENRDDGLLRKYEALGEEPIWHFIGSLQTRKVKQIIHKAAYIHSLDRISLAKEINKRANKPVKCFVQVNVSGEASKHGLVPEEVEDFIQQLQAYPNIVVVGLMTMAPHIHDQDALRTYFRKLKELQLDIQQLGLDNAPCRELSMGMSNDYEIAVEEGATFVRLGTSLVGEG